MDMRDCDARPAEVRALAESVSECATKTIPLLEQTVSSLAWLQNRAKADALFADSLTQKFKDCERVKVIDNDGTLCASLEETECSLQRIHTLLGSGREAAAKAPELDGHRAEVVSEYKRTIAAVADLHSMITDLREAIGEHDADLEQPTGEAFSDPEKLAAYLKTAQPRASTQKTSKSRNDLALGGTI